MEYSDLDGVRASASIEHAMTDKDKRNAAEAWEKIVGDLYPREVTDQ